MLFFLAAITLSVLTITICRRLAMSEVELPLSVYLGSYVLTTTIGASLIGLTSGKNIWAVLNPTMDISLLRDTGSFTYWLLLYSPLIFVPVFVAILGTKPRTWKIFSKLREVSLMEVNIYAYAATLGIISTYCFLQLYRSGYLQNITWSFHVAGDYEALILRRSEMMTTLGSAYYGLVYVSLPTLSHIALYQAVKKSTLAWRLMFLCCAVVNVYMCLSIVLKGPLLIYFFQIALGLVVLRVVRGWVLAISAVGGVLLLSAIQSLYLSDWTTLATVSLIIFRMADSFPFYVNLFPRYLSFTGWNYGLGLFGLGIPIDDNLRVFDYMYPSVDWVQGASAAPAHVRAYALSGMLSAIAALFLIALFIVCIAAMKRNLGSALQFGLYLQLLISLYYLTQGAIRSILVESYGVIFCFFVLGMLLLASITVQSAARNTYLINRSRWLSESQT
jgi:hypothetical protein